MRASPTHRVGQLRALLGGDVNTATPLIFTAALADGRDGREAFFRVRGGTAKRVA